jgi:hypothetical protein
LFRNNASNNNGNRRKKRNSLGVLEWSFHQQLKRIEHKIGGGRERESERESGFDYHT